MSWIHVIDEAESSEHLQNLYEEIAQKRGKVSNIMKVHSLNPDAMEKHMDLYLTIMFGSSELSREERELIAVVVSAANQYDYCITHHAESLNHYWKDKTKIQQLIHDYQSVDLSQRKHHMLEFALKITQTPHTVTKTDIETLRRTGFSDEDILNITLIASYFNFVNRIALGLGVKPTCIEVTGYKA